MKKNFRRAAMLAAAGLAMARSPEARAQSASLYGAAESRRPLTLTDSSWMYIKVEPPREIQLNDVVTIIIDEKSQLISQSMLMRRQRTNVDADLQKWLQFNGFGLSAAPMTNGDPRIEALYNLQNQVQANLRASDGLQFRIAATVADIRPNGNLVLEAHRHVRDNNEIWDASLSGIVRREDVLPNNTVLSEDIAELSVDRREEGHIRDSWRRGWFWKTLDRIKPF
ncbi:MAG TPA: flagellar basal body L-ring protein FlgH [Pirellulales bacterium]|jgi:flagellar L-ring protein precursor FlgH|nr:flagellar basal body L-ring protein FlgH [Pirellulales bacterium]